VDLPAPPGAERAVSFGTVAADYDRWRPGPIGEVADWLLPPAAALVVDLGAGTGALTRLLVERVATVVAVEPDERMRRVLAERVPSAEVVAGRGEAIPLGDGSADAVLASSSWHWMDPAVAAAEVARVVRPGGTLGVVWSGLDSTSDWFSALRPQAMLERLRSSRAVAAGQILEEAAQAGSDAPSSAGASPMPPTPRRHVLELPEGAPFGVPERTEICWTRPMTADDLVGLLSTFSGVITSEPEDRLELLSIARSFLIDEVGLEQGVPVEVPCRARCWRATRRDV
jgi:SAM-dependent methyltransferase